MPVTFSDQVGDPLPKMEQLFLVVPVVDRSYFSHQGSVISYKGITTTVRLSKASPIAHFMCADVILCNSDLSVVVFIIVILVIYKQNSSPQFQR